jgi:hypothetical protein
MKKKEVDLRTQQTLDNMLGKKRKEYELKDNIISVINLDGGVKIEVLENERGKFVDLRKYFNDNPTKKGIRLTTEKFKQIIEIIKNDLN